MQVAFHLGVHATDEDRLIRSLLRNREALSRQGVSIPAPGRYRAVIRQMLAPARIPVSAETDRPLLARICDDDAPRRLILSHDAFLGLPARAITNEGFYGRAGRRAAALAGLFPEAGCEFHMALRNPATLLPTLLALSGGSDYTGFMQDLDPLRLSWVPVVQQIRQSVPRARLVLWCDEDSPVLWGDLLQRLAGPGAALLAHGRTDRIEPLLSETGRARLRSALAAGPALAGASLRAMMAAHLERHALPGALETEICLPGWDSELVAEMTVNYDRDTAEIAAMEGVEMVLP